MGERRAEAKRRSKQKRGWRQRALANYRISHPQKKVSSATSWEGEELGAQGAMVKKSFGKPV